MNELVAVTSRETATALQNYSEAAKGAFSASTERALASDTRLWTSWCSDNGHAPLPAAPGAVVAFVKEMAVDRKPATVSRYLSSLAHMHRAVNLPDPTKANEVALAMRALRRSKPTRQRQQLASSSRLVSASSNGGTSADAAGAVSAVAPPPAAAAPALDEAFAA